MTDRLNVVRIRSQNVPAYTHLDDDGSLSLAPGKQRFRVLNLPGCHNVETQKIVSGQPVHVWQWPLSKKFVPTVCHLYFDTKCEQSVINPVLGKNVEHPRLTR